jgi:hypothetical protein
MTVIHIASGDFTLAEGRTLRGLLVPYGEVGQNASGEFIFSATSEVTLPTDPSVIGLKMAHDGAGAAVKLATATALSETERGIEADFAIAEGVIGDRLLAEYKTGSKKSLSAEFAHIVRDGKNVVSAILTGAATVVLGGFPSAAFFAIAEDAAPVEGEEDPTEPTAEELLAAAQELLNRLSAAQEQNTNPPKPDVPAAKEFAVSVPNTVSAKTETSIVPVTKAEAFALFNAQQNGTATEAMLARLNSAGGFARSESAMFALSDVKYDGTGGVQVDQRTPAWLGELWSGRAYVQKVIPLFGHADLSSKKAQGFRWVTKPAGANWAGNKANVPTSTPATELDEVTAQFWAMGHDVAIEHSIFNDGFIEAYLTAGTDAYAQWADAKAFADILAKASTVVADNPSGLSIGAGISALIDGVVQVITNNATPTFAFIAPALYKSILKTGETATLGYLDAALGFEEGTLGSSGFKFASHASLAAGNILVGAREAVTIHELPSIVKVQAPDTIKGGVDFNMFGAEATFVHKADALVKVTPFGA